ncbi:MAG: YezD family protein [Tumebacillaceae bacterium]
MEEQTDRILVEDPRVAQVLRALEGLEYGIVQITVHDSQILQIERTEKYRFAAERSEKSGKKQGGK